MRELAAGAIYFALVFSAGFLLGVVRVSWVAPRIGESLAELFEMPFMLVAIFGSARWMERRKPLPPGAVSRIAVGVVALGLMLMVEFGVVLQLRGLSIQAYLSSRDPVSGTAYLLMLFVFAAMPYLLWVRGQASSSYD